MNLFKKITISILFLIPTLSFAFTEKSDFQFFKKFEIKNPGIYYFDIDKDIESRSKKFLSDIRIFNSEEEEIPYKIKKETDEYKSEDLTKELNFKKLSKNVYLIDLKNETKDEYVNKISFFTDSRNFRRVISIEGADIKSGPWFNLNLERKRGDLVYDVPGDRKFNINFKYSNYKFLKLTVKGNEGSFEPKLFIKNYKKNTLIAGEKEQLKVFGIEKNFGETDQSIIFDLEKENLFFEKLTLLFNDKKFNRRYILYAANSADAKLLESGKRFQKNQEYWTKISSGNLKKDALSGSPTLNINNNNRYYRLDILNGDNKKLNLDFAFFERMKKKVYFKIKKPGEFEVYYSSPRVSAPKYDFNLSKEQFKLAKKIDLEKERLNKNFILQKKSIFDNNSWLIYFAIFFIILILGWFAFKIIRETENKTKKDEIKI